MLTGTVPFKAPNLQDLHKLILAGQFKIPDFVSEDAKSILTNMIKLEPKDRLTVPSILAHAWLKDTNDDSDTESD